MVQMYIYPLPIPKKYLPINCDMIDITVQLYSFFYSLLPFTNFFHFINYINVAIYLIKMIFIILQVQEGLKTLIQPRIKEVNEESLFFEIFDSVTSGAYSSY